MSCEFCDHYDFTSIAVRDNHVVMAGGSNRYDQHTDKGYKLFQHCPLCGANLLYMDSPNANQNFKRDFESQQIAIDAEGNRVNYAIFDGDTTISEKAYYEISDLRVDCGVSFSLAVAAYKYAKTHNGGYDMMVAYCKAKLLAVCTNCSFDERVEMFMQGGPA